jgi:nitric oxide synthase oxygenase domain/subunit
MQIDGCLRFNRHHTEHTWRGAARLFTRDRLGANCRWLSFTIPTFNLSIYALNLASASSTELGAQIALTLALADYSEWLVRLGCCGRSLSKETRKYMGERAAAALEISTFTRLQRTRQRGLVIVDGACGYRFYAKGYSISFFISSALFACGFQIDPFA